MEGNGQHVSRRYFLQRLCAIGLAGGGSVLLSACGGGDAGAACDDLSDLTDAQKEQRQQMVESLSYVEETPSENQYCANCSLYTQPEDGEQCGGCQLLPGPVHPNGYCTSWAPA